MRLMIPHEDTGKGDHRKEANGACSKEHDEDLEMIQGSHKGTIGTWR